MLVSLVCSTAHTYNNTHTFGSDEQVLTLYHALVKQLFQRLPDLCVFGESVASKADFLWDKGIVASDAESVKRSRVLQATQK